MPRPYPFPPHLRRFLSKGIRFHPFLPGIVLINPGTEILSSELRKSKQKVRNIAFGIDDNRRNIVHDCLF